MSIAQVIRDEEGNPAFAVVPWADYVALNPSAEDALLSDEQLYDKAKAEEGELFPSSIVDALLSGENPVKVFRTYRGLTQASLAEKTGLNKVYISQIETGNRKGSIETLKTLAEALSVDVDDLV
jgi:DNA-binding XRE family transcriptional regulator